MQLCENVMWIILIGLLSGVIAVCSLWEHSGNDAPSVRTANPSAFGSWVITETLLTQETHKPI